MTEEQTPEPTPDQTPEQAEVIDGQGQTQAPAQIQAQAERSDETPRADAEETPSSGGTASGTPISGAELNEAQKAEAVVPDDSAAVVDAPGAEPRV